MLPVLKISNESIKYYASLVNYYSVYKLKRFAESITDLYLLCFVYHRYQRIQDNLIETLIHHVRRYTDITKSAAKERIYESRLENNQNLSKAGLVLKLFADDRIAGDTPFREVQVQAFAILERQNLISLAEHTLRTLRSMKPRFNGNRRINWRVNSSNISGPFCLPSIWLAPRPRTR